MPSTHPPFGTPDAATLMGGRVLRTLKPSQRGALKLLQRFGETPVFVRHRVDRSGTTRFTTVELVVDSAPIHARPSHVVAVRVGVQERDLQAAVRAAGCRWDPAARLGRLPQRAPKLLRLGDRIVAESR